MAETTVVSQELLRFMPVQAQQFAYLAARKSFRSIPFDCGCFKQLARNRNWLAAEFSRHFVSN
jgi:hypothetical protein